MTESFIQLPRDGEGKKTRTNVVSVGGTDVHEQIIRLATVPGFNIPIYDETVLSYTGEDLTGVVYKLATVTVATLTLSYTDGKLTGVIKS